MKIAVYHDLLEGDESSHSELRMKVFESREDGYDWILNHVYDIIRTCDDGSCKLLDFIHDGDGYLRDGDDIKYELLQRYDIVELQDVINEYIDYFVSPYSHTISLKIENLDTEIESWL